MSTKRERAIQAQTAIITHVLPAIDKAVEETGLSYIAIAEELFLLLVQDPTYLIAQDIEVANGDDLSVAGALGFFMERLESLQATESAREAQYMSQREQALRKWFQELRDIGQDDQPPDEPE